MWDQLTSFIVVRIWVPSAAIVAWLFERCDLMRFRARFFINPLSRQCQFGKWFKRNPSRIMKRCVRRVWRRWCDLMNWLLRDGGLVGRQIGGTRVGASVPQVKVQDAFIDPGTIFKAKIQARHADKPVGWRAKHGQHRHQVMMPVHAEYGKCFTVKVWMAEAACFDYCSVLKYQK